MNLHEFIGHIDGHQVKLKNNVLYYAGIGKSEYHLIQYMQLQDKYVHNLTKKTYTGVNIE